MVNNEVYTGAGLSASMIPELDIDLGALMNISSKQKTLELCQGGDATANGAVAKDAVNMGTTRVRLLENMYKGCLATVTLKAANGDAISGETAQTLRIKSNTASVIVFNQTLSSTNLLRATVVIHGYGAPLPAPTADTSTFKLAADNWLGLVTTITPPTVDAELKQLNLAMGGTRNFGYQYKGAETLGEASIDVALNNGSWLYYALGDMTYNAPTDTDDDLNETLGADEKDFFFAHKTTGTANATFHRVMLDNATYRVFPPIEGHADGTAPNNYERLTDDGTTGEYSDIVYTITENDSGDLPSFALEVTAEKNNVSPWKSDEPGENLFSRIYTGCQVNSLTLNFEEGQEVTANISAMASKAHDAQSTYVPRNGVQAVTDLVNFDKTSKEDISPFMFSDGGIKIFGQQMARVKGGSLAIANNLTAQRFIGNYDRSITSAHIAGQRTYDINLNLLITDRSIWDELRNEFETTGTTASDGSSATGGAFGQIELEFTKSNGEFIKFKFDDYLTTSVDLPFPEDKGVLEVALTVSARTLPTNGCQYSGNWIIWG